MPQHVYNSAHIVYSERVSEITDQFVKLIKASGEDPTLLSGEKAKEFAATLVKLVNADAYCQQFNEMVKAGMTGVELITMLANAAELLETKPALFGKLLKGSGPLLKKVAAFLGPVGDIATGAFFVEDAYEHGPNQAAINLVKAVTFYDMAAKPLLEGTVKAAKGLIYQPEPSTDYNQMGPMLKRMDEQSSSEWH